MRRRYAVGTKMRNHIGDGVKVRLMDRVPFQLWMIVHNALPVMAGTGISWNL